MSQGHKLDSLDLVCGKTQFFYLKGTLEAESHTSKLCSNFKALWAAEHRA